MADFDTGRRDLVLNRWVPFSEPFLFEGFDYSGDTFAASVRAIKDSGGAALASFTFNTATVTTTDGIPTTSVTMSMTEAAIEGLPFPEAAELGTDVSLWWDMHITPGASTTKFRALEGTAIVKAGVTQ